MFARFGEASARECTRVTGVDSSPPATSGSPIGAATHGVRRSISFASSSLAGGLMAYGADVLTIRIVWSAHLHRPHPQGRKPADLPVAAVRQVRLIINLKTAKALGIEIPQTLLARADEVIE